MQSLLGRLLSDLLRMPGEFADVAATDPLSALLLLVGALLVAVSMGAFGYLTLGALVDLVTPDVSARGPPRAGR